MVTNLSPAAKKTFIHLQQIYSHLKLKSYAEATHLHRKSQRL